MRSPDALFEEVIQTVQSSMTVDESTIFCQFVDLASMLEDMRAVCAENKKHHERLLSCSRKMAAFSRAFAPYFDIINIFVQIKPEWLGWFWGSIRLVFKVCMQLISVSSAKIQHCLTLVHSWAATMFCSWRKLRICSSTWRRCCPSTSDSTRRANHSSSRPNRTGLRRSCPIYTLISFTFAWKFVASSHVGSKVCTFYVLLILTSRRHPQTSISVPLSLPETEAFYGLPLHHSVPWNRILFRSPRKCFSLS